MKKRALSILGAFGIFLWPILALAGYYGGSLPNHGHTSTAGDGGPLTNPVISGTATITNLTVSGKVTVTGSTASVFSNLTVTNLTVTNSNLNSSTFTTVQVGTLTIESQNFPDTDGTTSSKLRIMKNNAANGWVGLELRPVVGVESFHAHTNGVNGNAIAYGMDSNSHFVMRAGSHTHVGASMIDISFNGNTIIPGTLTMGGSSRILSASGLQGTSDGSSATAGDFGEYVSSATGALTTLATSTQFKDIVQMSLTAGDWDITGVINESDQGSASTGVTIGISTNSGNTAVGLTSGVNTYEGNPASATHDDVISIPRYRWVSSASTIVYLKCRGDYASTAPKVRGFITARRVR